MHFALNEKTAGHEIASLGERYRVLGPASRRGQAGTASGLALTLGQDMARMAGFEFWGTFLGAVSRKIFAV